MNHHHGLCVAETGLHAHLPVSLTNTDSVQDPVDASSLVRPFPPLIAMAAIPRPLVHRVIIKSRTFVRSVVVKPRSAFPTTWNSTSCAPATAATSPLTTSVASSSSATAATATVIASVLSAAATASVSAVLAVLLLPSDVDHVVRYSEVFDLFVHDN